MIKKILALGFLICLVTLMPAQSDVPDVTSTYAITNANVVVKPGQMLEGATIIIRDGLIENVGKNLQIPFDAEVIAADSLFVYAGFVAALSHAGLPKADDKKGGNSNSNVKKHDPPNDVAGITPEQSIRDLLKPSDGSISALRKEGFSIAHVVPNGRMMSGKGSLIILSGNTVEDMVLAENMSLYGSLLPSKTRVYPATSIAVMSKWRELYKQAELATDHEKKYKSAPSGMKRPSFDSSIKALYSVTNKSIPVFFHAPKTLDISRSMALQNELGFNMVLTDVKQGFKLKDKIKSKNIPMVISLGLPKKAKEDKKKKVKDEEADTEMKQLMERAKQAKLAYVSQAALLEDANVAFSMSIKDVKTSDIRANLRRMIEAGLSEDAALASLTTSPAKLLGISAMAGTIERGKMANLIVTDTTYFKEKANIKYVFVDGKKYKQEVKKKKDKKEGDKDAVIDLSGTWSLSIDAQGMQISGTMEIEKTDDGYTGTMTTDMDDEEETFDSIEVDGSSVTLKMTSDVNGSSAPVVISAVVEGDEFEGSVDIANGMMTAEVSGSKVSNP